MAAEIIYKLVFFVPKPEKEAVKQALFDQGAGRYSGYRECAWETCGQGQFKPIAGAKPFLGDHEQLSYVEEFRVEMICQASCIKPVLAALIQHHPYEEPAYEVWPIMRLEDF